MKAPDFWWQPPGPLAAAFAPAAAFYGHVAARRLARPGVRAGVPVICIGNMSVGGSGKTPTVLAADAALRRLGRRPAVLLRGYGGRLAGPVEVDPRRHRAAEVGDEALLLAAHATTIVARDRPAGAALAVAAGANVVLMDDGMQNPSLVKDGTLAVFDAARGLGNGRVLPAGPLRLAAERQWPLADAVLVIGDGAPGEAVIAEARRRALPVFRAALRPDPAVAASLAGRRVLAFAGIGRPSKLADTLAALGADVVALRAFPDHHPYRPADLARLRRDAAALGALLVTTQKDRVRLAELPGGDEDLTALPVTLAPADPAAFETWLARACA